MVSPEWARFRSGLWHPWVFGITDAVAENGTTHGEC
jgi:hypothetical protein